MTGNQPLVSGVSIDAPAKINLGLEILGRRDDGYHEIRTILQAIGLTDRVALSPASTVSIASDDPDLDTDENLALKAISLLQARSSVKRGARIDIEKRIPVASGLGGASTDAAAALLAGRALWQLPTSGSELHAMAASLGSDVPFFLHGGTALAAGRGDELEALPAPPSTWLVLISLNLVLPRKTASLYAALSGSDFSHGESVGEQCERLRGGRSLDPGLLGNAFSRALYALVPAVAELPSLMREHGAPNIALSGAGPTHYAIVDDPMDAARLARNLQGAVGSRARVIAVPAHADGPRVTVMPG